MSTEPRNQVKIIDLGLAKFIMENSPSMLFSSPIAPGTIYYMSPEQKENYESVTPASDIYSFGVVMYKLLGGKLPVIPNWRITLSKYVPEELVSIIEKCLRKSETERYFSFREFKKDLGRFVDKVKNGELKVNENLRCLICGYISNEFITGNTGLGIQAEKVCPLCEGSLIEFDFSKIKNCERNIYTWNGYFDIE